MIQKLLLAGLVALTLAGCENNKSVFIERIKTKNDMPTAIAKLRAALKSKGLTYVETIDHAKNARKFGLRLKPETVIVFGNPEIGTKLMTCNPSMGLDLPLRMLFITNYEGETSILYTNPEYWSLKHNIKDKTCLAIVRQAHAAMQELAEKAAAK
ncbi:DUF302 domain-containing protein [Sulfurovum sp.]|uniref:DUF302 domain-containing protein n=1 Tax=Sulfurovum sp. TaxID=1969726 RepID=UPI0025FA9837|nr:DUF302 domain-containing protein [Sulfurovum sp.]